MKKLLMIIISLTLTSQAHAMQFWGPRQNGYSITVENGIQTIKVPEELNRDIVDYLTTLLGINPHLKNIVIQTAEISIAMKKHLVTINTSVKLNKLGVSLLKRFLETYCQSIREINLVGSLKNRVLQAIKDNVAKLERLDVTEISIGTDESKFKFLKEQFKNIVFKRPHLFEPLQLIIERAIGNKKTLNSYVALGCFES